MKHYEGPVVYRAPNGEEGVYQYDGEADQYVRRTDIEVDPRMPRLNPSLGAHMAEIDRLRAELAEKQHSLECANALFRKADAMVREREARLAAVIALCDRAESRVFYPGTISTWPQAFLYPGTVRAAATGDTK